MKEYIGLPCKIKININGKSLYFKVLKVTSVTDSHITFIDKFNNYYSFKTENVDIINTEANINET